jgi:hypothetical protein
MTSVVRKVLLAILFVSFGLFAAASANAVKADFGAVVFNSQGNNRIANVEKAALARQPSANVDEPLKKILEEQRIENIFPFNPLKYSIRKAVTEGVSPSTIVLLLLLPAVAALIAAARHIVGLRGFGIFLPASLSVVFVATGPLLGILLFLVIVVVSTLTRITLRHFKVKLQYLPRMALILHIVVIGILLLLFLAPVVGASGLSGFSIFPVLILILLSEDFTRVQLGKSAKVAVNLTAETLILSLTSYALMSLQAVQKFAILNPEIWVLLILAMDFLMGKYVGLRIMEYYRFRKLIKS